MKNLNSKMSQHFPLPESEGGWCLLDKEIDKSVASIINYEQLNQAIEEYKLFFENVASGAIVIKDGLLVKEHYSFMTLPGSRFDVWSCTKSFTGIAWGLLLEESKNGTLPDNIKVNLDSFAYSFLPESFKITDKQKEKITINHLLSMTSGIPGENQLVFGIPPRDNNGPFEHALGYQENRYGYKTDKLISEPGTFWDYSDPAIAHLSILFKIIMRREMHEYMQDKVFSRIGIENASWDVHGGGPFIGPHTSAHVGLHISARELARFGYLLMQNGKWGDDQIIPSIWVDKATKPSQTLNPEYGFTFWVNTHETRWPGLPKDMFSLEGYNSNRCYVIPSKELVVVRVGSGPNQWNEQLFVRQILKAIN